MEKTLLGLDIIFLLLVASASSQTCQKVSSCKCNMTDAGGQVNLMVLSTQVGSDSFFSIPGNDGWLYKYNPCYGFTFGSHSDLAVAQTTANGYNVYDLGVQSSAYFNTSANGEVSIHYTALDEKRMSRVLLVCTSGVNTHSLKFIGELTITEYDFILESPCACPGLCDDMGIINPVAEPGPPSNSADINVNLVNPKQPNPSPSIWSDVGSTMVGLVFHDFFLVLVIAAVLAVIKLTSCSTSSPPVNGGRGFGPDDVTGQPSMKINGDSLHADSEL